MGMLSLALALASCAAGPKVATQDPTATAATKEQSESAITAGDATRSEGKFEDALEIYRGVLRVDAGSNPAQLGAAESLLGLSRPAEALTIFEQLLNVPALHNQAIQGKGIALLALGRKDGAGEALRAAVQADPTLWRSWNGLGFLADDRRDAPAAEEAYAHALEANPNSSLLLNNLGYSRLLAGKVDDAWASLRSAYRIDPKNPTIENNIRLALAMKGSYAAAVRGGTPNQQSSILNNVGYIAMQKGDLSVAGGYLQQAMERSTSYNAVAAQNISQLKSKMGSNSPGGESAAKVDADIKP